MKHAIRLVAVLAFLTAGVTIAAAQSRSRDDHRRQSEKSKPDQKADHNHDSHLGVVNRRGDR